MTVDLPQSGVGEIAFAATAQLDITARSPVEPWIAFQLFDKLKVDSAHDLRVKVTGARSELELPPMPAEPKSIKFNDLEGLLAGVKSVGWRD